MRIVPVPVLTGTTWEEAVEKLSHRQRELVMMPLSQLRIEPTDCSLVVREQSYGLTTWAAKQLATRLRIASSYVLRIDNEIAATNFNHFLGNAIGSAQVIIEDGKTVTGFLGERSVPVPMGELADKASRQLQGYDLQSWRYDVSGATFRMTGTDFRTEPRKGDIVQIGVDLLNRDNAEGGLGIRGVAYRLTCLNGATAPEPAGLGRQIRREGWRDPDARIQIAFGVIRDTTDTARMMAERLPELTAMEVPWTDAYDRNLAIVGSGLRRIHDRPIAARTLAQTVVETMSSEEKTAYGLYNALTQIGRDSLDERRRALFERAGFALAQHPNDPLRAIHEAADAFSVN